MLICSILLLWAVLADGIPYEVCDVRTANGIPVGTQRICSVLQDPLYSCTNGSSYAHQWTTGNCNTRSVCEPSCIGFVGMNLTYECFEGAQLYRYKDGEYQNMSGASVTYGLLLPEHAGIYECRDSSGKTVYTQNITVNSKFS